jgi:hypothetical protein
MNEAAAQLQELWEHVTAELRPRLAAAWRAWDERTRADVRLRLLSGFVAGAMIGKVVNRAGR